jgi:hypothetical protein
MDETTVGICATDEGLTLERVVVGDVADDVARVAPSAVVMPVAELDEDKVLVGMTIVTVLI